MMNLFAKKMFDSALGVVNEETVMKALELMLYGMGGIFVVMVLIFLVIYILNKAAGKKKDDQK